MTVRQLIGLCKKHGHQLYLNRDGRPAVRPFRKGETLPNDVQQLLVDNRQLVIDWFTNSVRRDGETCSVCRATISINMTPDDAATICSRVPTKKTPGCPYRSFQ